VWHLPTDAAKLTGREIISLFATKMNVKNKVFVIPMWLLKGMGFFVPLLREMPEMMYQYDRDYFFDSSKFANTFHFRATSYTEGVREIVENGR